MDKLTKKQRAVLDCIESCIREKGYGPTVREICTSMNLSSPSTVHVHLNTLEEKGYIARDPLKSRSISLTYSLDPVDSLPEEPLSQVRNIVQVPLVGLSLIHI